MVFIVDENISPEAVPILTKTGLVAYHVNHLKASPSQRIVDDQLRRLTIRKGAIIITKDDDFVKSFVDRKVPEKMVYLYGSQSKSQDLDQIRSVAPQLLHFLMKHDFIEVRPDEIRFPFSD